ncbi:phage tail protein [Nocardioides immobilis]|uniref:Phage tail protein n=1 Tax=Nocardioides immobilis TaxID=2049295 RepID=A0A417XT13_9ACTN|nr:phage tail protein [Nocardioides immobilis]RHW23357.1 phage tail protein [Nocardioides immobilis]
MYPLTTLHFAVSWQDSQNTSSFSEVSGLTMEAEIVEYRGGADLQLSTRKQPGLKKFGNVTLKRGIAPADAGNGLFEWYNTILAGSVQRRNVTVSLLNEERAPVMTWKIRDAWPVKVEGPGLKSTGTDVSLETVEFACEGIEIEVA